MLQALNYDALPDVKDANAALLALLDHPRSPANAGSMNSTIIWYGPIRWCALVQMRRLCALKERTRLSRCPSIAMHAIACSIPMKALRSPLRNVRATWPALERKPIGVTDCLNFGNPQRPEVMWQFVLAIEGLKDACEALSVPIVSGNVSLYNETNDLSIYPTPVIGMVGLIEPADCAVTQWFKQNGDVIILLGSTREDLGGTEYLKVLHHREQGSPPLLNLDAEKAVQACTIQLFARGSYSRPTIAPMADWLLPSRNVASLAQTSDWGLWYTYRSMVFVATHCCSGRANRASCFLWSRSTWNEF